MRRLAPAIPLLALVLFSGCSEPPLEFTEVKRADERLTEAEIETLLRIAQSLPKGRLPEILVFSPPADWKPTRTLPVRELVDEEARRMAQRWDEARLAEPLLRDRRLTRVLERERLTPEQFVGLMLTTGLAMARTTLRPAQDLEGAIQRGGEFVRRLEANSKSFAAHSAEARFQILQQAAWLTRIDRAEHLQLVPPENVALVQKYRQPLLAAFGDRLVTNPLDAVVDPLDEWGVPFEIPAGGPRDDELSWDPRQAIVGHDD
ncbi:MAG: hypothetical protein KY476_02005 [Planctomycetes bacterium]|nr:hypothetical protein [Planctomycetota bacterium]